MPAAASDTFNCQGLQPVYDSKGVKEIHARFGNSLTIAKGTVVGKITATGLWAAYATGASDGTDIARGLLAYDLVTDASGGHTIGGGEQGAKYTSAPIFICGYFKLSELTLLDAAAIVDFGRLVDGAAIADATILEIYGG